MVDVSGEVAGNDNCRFGAWMTKVRVISNLLLVEIAPARGFLNHSELFFWKYGVHGKNGGFEMSEALGGSCHGE